VEVVRANGLEIAYERVGEGPPLVFVHGGTLDGRMWQPQLAALADEFTVVAWDEPGAGRSSDVPADFALRSHPSQAVRRRPADRIRRAARRDGRRRPPEERVDSGVSQADTDQRDLLPRIAVPTLLIWGDLDARSPLDVARQFEQAIPGTRLVVIPGAGHVSNLEQPGRCNEAVRESCRANPSRQIRS
jgi:pimeloyl-ACP methyl ester carboxylesterase